MDREEYGLDSFEAGGWMYAVWMLVGSVASAVLIVRFLC